MGQYTEFLRDKLQDHLHGTDPYSAPDQYLGLSSADPTDDGSGIVEPTSDDYDRVEVDAWDASDDGVVANTNQVEFERATEAWGDELTHWFISDSPTGGNILKYGELPAPITVTTGIKVIVEAGALTATLSNPA